VTVRLSEALNMREHPEILKMLKIDNAATGLMSTILNSTYLTVNI
jgi:hypothetical protein